MSEIVAEAIARTLRLDAGLHKVHADPPEGVHDFPTALVLETSGFVARGGLRGLWEATITARVWVLMATRRDLASNVNATRPWGLRLVRLFAKYDELLTEADVAFGEIEHIEYSCLELTYAKMRHVGIEVLITARVDINVAVGT